MYYMCSLQLPVIVIKAIDTARKNCLWRGNNPGSTRKSLASWEKVCTPKEKGGLGVVNLRIQNVAMLMKHLVKVYSGTDLPWVNLVTNSYLSTKVPHLVSKRSFWRKGIIALADVFRGIAKCIIKTGTTALFWSDISNEHFKSQQYQHLYAEALYTNDSVKTMCARPMEDSFLLPLSDQVYSEYLQLEDEHAQLHLQQGTWDILIFLWNNDCYTSKSFYKLNFSALQVPRPLVWLWKLSV